MEGIGRCVDLLKAGAEINFQELVQVIRARGELLVVALWCDSLVRFRDGGKDCPHQSNAERPAVIISPEERGVSLG